MRVDILIRAALGKPSWVPDAVHAVYDGNESTSRKNTDWHYRGTDSTRFSYRGVLYEVELNSGAVTVQRVTTEPVITLKCDLVSVVYENNGEISKREWWPETFERRKAYQVSRKWE